MQRYCVNYTQDNERHEIEPYRYMEYSADPVDKVHTPIAAISFAAINPNMFWSLFLRLLVILAQFVDALKYLVLLKLFVHVVFSSF